MLYCQVIFYVKKCIIKFVVFVMNSVVSISILFCPVLFINLFTPIEGAMTHQHIQGVICGPDGLDLVSMILRSPIAKSVHTAQKWPWL